MKILIKDRVDDTLIVTMVDTAIYDSEDKSVGFYVGSDILAVENVEPEEATVIVQNLYDEDKVDLSHLSAEWK